jgi:hypothetical protein
MRQLSSSLRVNLDEVTFNGVKVFSTTMHKDRDRLGERVTEWLAANPGLRVAESLVLQSSDEAFHCLSIVLFYEEETKEKEPGSFRPPGS